MSRPATAARNSTAHWQALDREHHLHPFTDFHDLNERGTRVITRAEHIYIYDADGKEYLDGMSDEDVVGLNIPTGIPLRYDLDGDLKPTVIGGTYLDPEAAAAGAAAVAAQGAK